MNEIDRRIDEISSWELCKEMDMSRVKVLRHAIEQYDRDIAEHSRELSSDECDEERGEYLRESIGVIRAVKEMHFAQLERLETLFNITARKFDHEIEDEQIKIDNARARRIELRSNKTKHLEQGKEIGFTVEIVE